MLAQSLSMTLDLCSFCSLMLLIGISLSHQTWCGQQEAHKALILVKGQTKNCGKELVDHIKYSEEVSDGSTSCLMNIIAAEHCSFCVDACSAMYNHSLLSPILPAAGAFWPCLMHFAHCALHMKTVRMSLSIYMSPLSEQTAAYPPYSMRKACLSMLCCQL